MDVTLTPGDLLVFTSGVSVFTRGPGGYVKVILGVGDHGIVVGHVNTVVEVLCRAGLLRMSRYAISYHSRKER